jgi:hypothetical protein
MNLPDISQQKPVGKGSSRTVYLMGNRVAKVARGRYKRLMRGLAQNRAEYEIWKYATSERGVTHLCPIIDITPDDEILVMAKATPISNLKEMPESARENLRVFKRRLRYIYIAMCGKHRHQINTERVIEYNSNPKTQQEMRKTFKSKLWYDIQTLVYDYGLVLGDIVRPSSWGYYKGRFVLIDYGLTKTVLDEWYKV